jgi:tRNA modification GTPase
VADYYPDTIAAIATPAGEGAIAIIRVSGPDAIAVVDAAFKPSGGSSLSESDNRPRLGTVHGNDGPIDEVLVLVMRAPHSYTSEDVVEIHGHGSSAAVNAVLDCVLRRGVRCALPGEFTKRAFLNGRIDLVQAEAVIDRIQAQTSAALRSAHDAASGTLSTAIHKMRETLAGALARIEAAIDFPDDDLPELVDQALRDELQSAFDTNQRLLSTANTGRRLREGARVAIVGRPNVGKSSLFNALVRDARAIVTPHAGTTRDRLDETINIGGIPVHLADTAGLRETTDEIEQIGVGRAREALESADAILLVVDASTITTAEDDAIAQDVLALDVPSIAVMNKCDLVATLERPAWASDMTNTIQTAALIDEGIHELEEALSRLLMGSDVPEPGQAIITRAHQQDSLRRAADALKRLLENYNASPEFLALDLREALHALGEITGETTSEDILDLVFGEFCLGK